MNSFGVENFAENKRLFGDLNTAPEKYNLYGGLVNMARGLQQISTQLDNLTRLLAKRTQK